MHTPDSDDEQLSIVFDQYFKTLGEGDPAQLPLRHTARFTENGQVLGIGTGLWATATGSTESRAVVVADTTTGNVAGWGLVHEVDQLALLGVRLRVDGGLIDEVETLVLRPGAFGRPEFGYVDGLRHPTDGLYDLLPEADRCSRDELIRVANCYLDGVATDDADIIPVDDEAIRIENGRQTVLNPDAVGFSKDMTPSDRLKLGVAAQIRLGDFRYIEAIRDRRFIVVDESRGLVMLTCFFDHPGQIRGDDYVSPFATPNSMPIWELFKVQNGLICHIEAIMTVLPYGIRAGWE